MQNTTNQGRRCFKNCFYRKWREHDFFFLINKETDSSCDRLKTKNVLFLCKHS
ncbi:hypothetical protein M0802_016625 [Mischocyttarus mexicanus]|nr:hypothetical protein M0802_016625 [Mischocyttarus mexicanus]